MSLMIHSEGDVCSLRVWFLHGNGLARLPLAQAL